MSVTSIVQGNGSKISMMRVATLLVVVVILSVFIAHNIVSMTKGLGFVSMGYQEALLLASSLGLKVAQRFIEGSRPMPSTAPIIDTSDTNKTVVINSELPPDVKE